MNDHDDSDNQSRNVDVQQANLGDMLRHARELRELSIEDLAHCLRLEPRIIRQLENDQVDQLPAPAFTRGYVRSIAKELDVDSAPLLAVLDLRFASEPPALSDFKSRAPLQITADSNIIRYTTLALTVVMLILVALWWRTHDRADSAANRFDRPQEPVVTAPATAPLDYEFAIVDHPDDPYFRGTPTLLSTAPALTPPPAPPAPPPTENVQTATEPTASPASAASNDEIVITAREDAWIEVRDALGASLYYNLVRPGRELRLSGEPPYQLTIGNALAVSLSYGQQQVALEAFMEKGIARFELGADPAQR